jgi:hypothetical protein
MPFFPEFAPLYKNRTAKSEEEGICDFLGGKCSFLYWREWIMLLTYINRLNVYY